MFRIAATQHNIHEKAYEFYISGCKGDNGHHCVNCHNPQLWDPNQGDTYDIVLDKVWETIELGKRHKLINSIRIYGGEPIEKPMEELRDFLFQLKKTFGLEIWLFTRFEFEEVPKELLSYLDYVKCGPYLPELTGEVEYYGVILATTNQRIFKKGVDF